MPEEERQETVQIEGTQFYRRSRYADIFRIIIITVVIFAMLTVLSAWFIIDSGARQAYKEARDVRKALRAVGTEYYGELTSIYDPNRADGMTDGAADKVAFISQRKGKVTLYDWDELNNGPLSFEYTKGMYRVVYKDTGIDKGISSGVEGDFKVYYSFELLKYEAQ